MIEATLRGEAGSGTGAPRLLGRVERGIQESCVRVLNAFPAQGLAAPRANPLLNFAPAGIRKVGAHFDLPMALALAGASGLLDRSALRRIAALGELSMQGRVLPCGGGAFVIARAARAAGWRTLLCAPEDAPWAALAAGVDAIAVPDLATAVAYVRGVLHLQPASPTTVSRPAALSGRPPPELADLRGLRTAKRALIVAAAGRHDLLMVGPPGCGKTALARRLAALLPQPVGDEAGEILAIRDAAAAHGGSASPPDPRPHRPFRAPHHTSSQASLLGGGPEPRPGEITLAHHGVLFLDEMAEFRRSVLEGLRQPLEEHGITIGRARSTVYMPADFVLVGAMNPCPCGWDGHPDRHCVCGPLSRSRYLRRVSGPMLDRFDLRLVVPALRTDEMDAPAEPPTTEQARLMVEAAQERQRARGCANARLEDSALEAATTGSARDGFTDALRTVVRRRRASGRARVKLLRIARTIADLEDRDRLEPGDAIEAERLRGSDRWTEA